MAATVTNAGRWRLPGRVARRLAGHTPRPGGWELAPYEGDDLRGTSLRGANMLVPFHEVYAVRTHQGQPAGMPQVSYIAFVSQARNQATGELATGLSPEVRPKRGRAVRRWHPERPNEGRVRWR